MNIGISVGHHARRHPRRLAVEEDGGRSLTYADLEARSNRLAHYLAEVAGLGTGDRVGYLLYNRLEVVELLVACAKLGVIAAPMNFRLTETDLRAIFANAGVRLVVTQGEFADLVRCLGSELGFGVMLADQDYVQAVGSGATSPPGSRLKTAGSADALIQYTSGTTGRPKGATFTHDAVLMHAANVALEYATRDGRHCSRRPGQLMFRAGSFHQRAASGPGCRQPGPMASWVWLSSGMGAWVARWVVLVVRLVRVPVLGAGTVTTAMLHRRGSDHRDAPSSWLGPGRCRDGPGACGAGVAAGARRPGRLAAGPGWLARRAWRHCCSDCHRRYRSVNSARSCGVRSSGVSWPVSLIVSRICARYSVQCGQAAR